MRATTLEFLLIESNEGATDLLRCYLQHRSHQCHVLSAQSEISSWLLTNGAEVAVIDLSSTNPLALISTVRQLRRDLPIIALTGGGCDQVQMNAALRAGATGYVSRNLPLDQLYCVLSRVLARARFQARRLRAQRHLLGAA